MIFDFVGMFIFSAAYNKRKRRVRMLNKLWGFMILIGILFAAATSEKSEQQHWIRQKKQ